MITGRNNDRVAVQRQAVRQWVVAADKILAAWQYVLAIPTPLMDGEVARPAAQQYQLIKDFVAQHRVVIQQDLKPQKNDAHNDRVYLQSQTVILLRLLRNGLGMYHVALGRIVCPQSQHLMRQYDEGFVTGKTCDGQEKNLHAWLQAAFFCLLQTAHNPPANRAQQAADVRDNLRVFVRLLTGRDMIENTIRPVFDSATESTLLTHGPAAMQEIGTFFHDMLHDSQAVWCGEHAAIAQLTQAYPRLDFTPRYGEAMYQPALTLAVRDACFTDQWRSAKNDLVLIAAKCAHRLHTRDFSSVHDKAIESSIAPFLTLYNPHKRTIDFYRAEAMADRVVVDGAMALRDMIDAVLPDYFSCTLAGQRTVLDMCLKQFQTSRGLYQEWQVQKEDGCFPEAWLSPLCYAPRYTEQAATLKRALLRPDFT